MDRLATCSDVRSKYLDIIQYLGLAEDIPTDFRGILFKRKFLTKFELFKLICYGIVNCIPEEVITAWCVTRCIVTVPTQVEDIKQLYTRFQNREQSLIAYYAYDIANSTCVYVTDKTIVKDWVEGHWSQTYGKLSRTPQFPS